MLIRLFFTNMVTFFFWSSAHKQIKYSEINKLQDNKTKRIDLVKHYKIMYILHTYKSFHEGHSLIHANNVCAQLTLITFIRAWFYFLNMMCWLMCCHNYNYKYLHNNCLCIRLFLDVYFSACHFLSQMLLHYCFFFYCLLF